MMSSSKTRVQVDKDFKWGVYTHPAESFVVLSMETGNTTVQFVVDGNDFSPEELETMAVRCEIMASRYVNQLREEAMRKRGEVSGKP